MDKVKYNEILTYLVGDIDINKIGEHIILLNNEFDSIKDNIFENKKSFEEFILLSSVLLDNIKVDQLSKDNDIEEYKKLEKNFDISMSYLNFLKCRMDSNYINLFPDNNKTNSFIFDLQY